MSIIGPINVYPSEGDHLIVDRDTYLHRGIAMPGGWVFTSAPGRGEHLCTLAEFAGGRRVVVERIEPSLRYVAVQNAYAMIANPSKYDLWLNNCEHAVNRAYAREARSEQVERRALVAVVVTVFVVAIVAARRA